jgi:hypothetical protein
MRCRNAACTARRHGPGGHKLSCVRAPIRVAFMTQSHAQRANGQGFIVIVVVVVVVVVEEEVVRVVVVFVVVGMGVRSDRDGTDKDDDATFIGADSVAFPVPPASGSSLVEVAVVFLLFV